MLTDLHVKNLALIDEAEVSFGPGLNILTGETGAGKSILIGSISLALGQKMTKGILRKGTTEGFVELVFQIDNEEIRRKLAEEEIFPEEDMLILSRKFSEKRSLSKINGESCTLQQLRKISRMLLDIHGQREHQILLEEGQQLAILDAYGAEKIFPLREKTSGLYHSLQRIEKDLAEYTADEAERNREMDFLQFEIREIEEANLLEGEEEELEISFRRMNNAKKILEALSSAGRMTGDEGAGDLITGAVRLMEEIAGLDEDLQNMTAVLEDTENLLSDFNRAASDYVDAFHFDEGDFAEVQIRLDTIAALKKKYGRTIDAILHTLEEKKQRLEKLLHFEERKKDLQKKEEKALQELRDAAEALTKEREKQACQMEEKLLEALKDLNFASVQFEISFERLEKPKGNGQDQVTFLISTNPGESIRPLSDVVSGGELSRIMLAIRTLLADKDETATLIFDEIDSGISGRTAQKVSEKMAVIAGNHQVLCITHLAQIASMADSHYVIEKKIEEGRSVTKVRLLNKEESIEELARILGGSQLTETVRRNAEEMKMLAEQRKAALRKKR